MANNTYDYRGAMREDVREWLNNNQNGYISDDRREEIYDTLWTCDSVTGNASGSYTFSRWMAEENLCHNWDLLAEAADEFCIESVGFSKGAEYWDVTIRCYLLSQVLAEVVEAWNGEHPEPDGDDENEAEG